MTANSGREAVQNARSHNSWDVGMCLNFVRQPCWEVPGVYASAIDAWNGARKKHPGDRTPPLGAPLFYRGGQYGHVVIGGEANDPDMRGTDMPSSGRVSEEQISWVETHWGYEYLGWTEDLNGVMLPLGEEEDMPLSEDDLQKIAQRVNKIIGEYGPDGKPRDPDNEDPETGNERLGQILKVVKDIQKKVSDQGGE